VCEQVRIDSDEFCECALHAADATDHAIYLIAGFEGGYAGSYLFNDSGHIEAEHCREWLPGVRCYARTDLGVERIDAAGLNPDQNVVGFELRAWKIYLPKIPVGLFDNIGLHPLSFMRWRRSGADAV
jgi:hypothetical protein